MKHGIRICILPAILLLAGCDSGTEVNPESVIDQAAAQPLYVGGTVCAECHIAQTNSWRNSHHDLAMQVPDDETVLGDFSGSTFVYNGIESTFSRTGDEFIVTTDGPDGNLSDYVVQYVFGVEPLQQYLLELPGGRLQAFSIAWDTRPADAGGQRWFHIYPDEAITYADELHWTRVSQNWNFMCAECHSTNLQKNFSLAADAYATTYSDIDVSCEACHGPGSDHVRAARERDEAAFEPGRNANLMVDFGASAEGRWGFADGEPIASLSAPRDTSELIGTCAQCHSRRTTIRADVVHQESFYDSHRLSLLEPSLYHVDGQIDDEVYVFGSFLQSKMHAAGVSCSDCHDAHSLQLKATGNEMCATCHTPAVFDTAKHHLHASGTPGSQCVDCHMPAQNYMVVDPRRDHSFRVPRPDLTVTTGAPNACTGCHVDQSAEWAARMLVDELGVEPVFHYAQAFAAARDQQAGAKGLLQTTARDASQPAIARATALSLLGGWPGSESINTLRAGLNSADPLERIGALEGMAQMPAQARYELAGRMLSDPVRSVRIAAVRQLAGINRMQLTASQQREFVAAIEEYIVVQNENADRGFAHTNLGNLFLALGEGQRAVAAYKTAIDIEPEFIPAYINLADYYRATGAEAQAEDLLRKALAISPEAAGVHYALGLALTRQDNYAQALESLSLALELNPDNPQFLYVYAIALASTQQIDRGVAQLVAGHDRWPANRDILSALMTLNAESGNVAAAREYGARLLALTPQDRALSQYLQNLEPR
jgi:tetratricopeptide (TPR) repeat protein